LKIINLKISLGFTLMEVLVSLSIFAIVSVAVITMFSTSLRIEQRGSAYRGLQQNGLYIMELLGKEIRNGRIDYISYGGTVSNPVDALHLIYRGSTDLDEEISLDTSTTPDSIILRRENPSLPGSYNEATLTNTEVNVDSLTFYITPPTECTDDVCDDPGKETVTIIMHLSSNAASRFGSANATVNLQTTFTTRAYEF